MYNFKSVSDRECSHGFVQMKIIYLGNMVHGPVCPWLYGASLFASRFSRKLKPKRFEFYVRIAFRSTKRPVLHLHWKFWWIPAMALLDYLPEYWPWLLLGGGLVVSACLFVAKSIRHRRFYIGLVSPLWPFDRLNQLLIDTAHASA